MGRNDFMGCDRLADMEKLAAFSAMEVRATGGASAPRRSLCGPAYLHQHSLGRGHSGKTVGGQEIGFHDESLSSHIVGVYFHKRRST